MLQPIMLKVWRLNWHLRSIRRSYAKQHKQLEKRKAPSDEFQELDADEYFDMQEVEKEIDAAVGNRLFHEARSLDVETPPISDEQMWFHDDENSRVWFTPKGRAHVRKLIDEEKARRFDVKTRWVTNIIIPLAALLGGIMGAITGLVAVLQHKR